MMKKFNIGDRVEVLDDDLKGTIIMSLKLLWIRSKKAVYLANLSLPLRGRPHIRLSMLRAASLHEAQNSLNSTTFLIQNSRFKIQNR